MNTLPLFSQDDNPTLKQCSKCPNSYPATPEFFCRHKKAKDGLKSICKVCSRAEAKISNAARAKERSQYYQDHKEEITKYKKKWRKDNIDQIKEYDRIRGRKRKDEKSKYDKEYYSQNKERISKRNGAYGRNHRERLNNAKRRYIASHKEAHHEWWKIYRQSEHGRMVMRAAHHKRKAQKKAVGGSYTAAQLQEQLKRQKRKCYYCNAELGKGKAAWHADHIVPLSKGGSNNIDNIVIACPACNLRKHDKLPHEWLEGGRLL